MISGQTTNVDAASGATYSSNGIITAVRNALSKAETGKSSTKKKKKKNKKNKKKNSGSNSNNNNNNIAAPEFRVWSPTTLLGQALTSLTTVDRTGNGAFW